MPAAVRLSQETPPGERTIAERISDAIRYLRGAAPPVRVLVEEASLDRDGRVDEARRTKTEEAGSFPTEIDAAAEEIDGGPEIDGHKAMVPLAIVLAAGRSSSEGRSVKLSELLPEAGNSNQ